MKNLAANLSTTIANFFKSSTLAMTDYSSGSFHSNTQSSSFQNSGMQFKKIKRFFRNSPYLPFVLVGVVVVIIAGVVIGKFVSNQSQSSTQTLGAAANNSKQVTVAKPIAIQTLNKNFDFPLKDSTGKEVSKIHYQIQSAELDNQIVVQGQVATAVQGRVFLVLNLKITNNYSKSVQLNTRDYIRLIVGNSSDKLAADIHSDPVDIEAIATKYTRLGFPIDANAKSLKLEVGEISGTKQTINLNLK
ncbi:MAG TPA: hypothetical protein VND99_01925 [Candidatus Acidoferrales bacterium]|nr:hypothetical protein [Candidatus Acidoferrales bacterium]